MRIRFAFLWFAATVKAWAFELRVTSRETIFRTTVAPEDGAAIVVRTSSGEGGYVVPSRDFLPELRRICIGMESCSSSTKSSRVWAGRDVCGQLSISTLCAGHHLHGEAIGGGLPLGVTLAREDLMRWHVGAHASTFGGNPVALAAAMATFEILENGVMAHGARIGDYILERLREMKERQTSIADVRGLGLMIGIEFVKDRTTLEPWPELRDRIVVECFNRGLILQGAGETSIRFSPPLIIDRDQADFALKTFEAAIKSSIK
jgi:4-aminobutyrate aminotransferase